MHASRWWELPLSGNDFLVPVFFRSVFRPIQLFNLMEALQVNYDGLAAVVLGEHAGEAGVLDDLVGGVGSAAVHPLGTSFLHAVEQDEELTLSIVQALVFH